MMDGWDKLDIGRKTAGFWITPELALLYPDQTSRNQASTIPDWSGENLKLWILSGPDKPNPNMG